MKRVLGGALFLGGCAVIFFGTRLSGITLLGLLLAFTGLGLLYSTPDPHDEIEEEALRKRH